MSCSNGHSLGGLNRAKKLTEEERSLIASNAARVRWAKEAEQELPKVTHPGVLQIGELKIPCAVLNNGRRVLSESGITEALLGSRSGASKRKKKAMAENSNIPLPMFIAPSQLQPYISSDFQESLIKPILYMEGRRKVFGFDAQILPAICDIWLRARESGALQRQQLQRAQNAEILMRGLAKVGIIALVDEVTGYQQERDREELHNILAFYLAEEKLRWAKRFPDEFYKQMYRLKGWNWPNAGKRTPYVGKITNAIVYEKLPIGVLEELRNRNPTVQGTGRRKWKHHQFLSEDIGQQDLRDHLLQLIAVMRASPDWTTFEKNFEQAFPGLGNIDSIEAENKS